MVPAMSLTIQFTLGFLVLAGLYTAVCIYFGNDM